MKFLVEQVEGNIDILMILEPKIDDSFPIGNSVIDGDSSPYRLDRYSNGGGILLYIRKRYPVLGYCCWNGDCRKLLCGAKLA